LAKHYTLPLIKAVDEYSDRAYLAFVGISHFFKYVCIASTYTQTKPFADPLVWVALKMGARIIASWLVIPR
jgi:hypothetical protein